MKDKLIAVKVVLRILLQRVEAVKIPEQINYETENKINQLSNKLYEASNLLEEIEMHEYD